MKKPNKICPAPDWGAIFRERPDLEPPGYKEAFDKITTQEESHAEIESQAVSICS